MRTTKPEDRSSRSSHKSTSRLHGSRAPKGSSAARGIPGAKALEGVSNRALLSGIRKLSETERKTVLSILVHLVEIDRRKLYLSMGYSSLFEFCRGHLKYSESVAGRRIAVARCMGRSPRVSTALFAQGRSI